MFDPGMLIVALAGLIVGGIAGVGIMSAMNMASKADDNTERAIAEMKAQGTGREAYIQRKVMGQIRRKRRQG